jgi:hypothetical protein
VWMSFLLYPENGWSRSSPAAAAGPPISALADLTTGVGRETLLFYTRPLPLVPRKFWNAVAESPCLPLPLSRRRVCARVVVSALSVSGKGGKPMTKVGRSAQRSLGLFSLFRLFFLHLALGAWRLAGRIRNKRNGGYFSPYENDPSIGHCTEGLGLKP